MPANFDLAPPPKTVDGLLAVPIDIVNVDATFTFDGAAQSAVADATISYEVGPTAGNPIFDLRQNVTQAWLDGAAIPPAQVAHHTFGTGQFTDLRVIEAVQAAGSAHTLRVQYDLALPSSQLGGSYLPALEWTAGPRLRFVFGLSDLNRCRYAEAWLPANLLFDQYPIDLEIQLSGTGLTHMPITTGVVTNVGANHWQIAFPSRSSAHSPLLEVRPTDTLTGATDSVVLPVSGTVTIEAWKPAGAATNLATEIANVKSFLIANENDYGPYVHDDRFVAFFNGGGMEYDGGTTTSSGALLHETFHSWFARGMRPSSQADGWWDEGFTQWHDAGANDTEPFDFTDSPVLLCSRDPWQRHTPGNSYSDGSAFWRGVAASVGLGVLNAQMSALYTSKRGDPVSTSMIEEHLVAATGNSQLVDCFHRFVYGYPDASPPPDVWMKDDPAHDGSEQWDGPFWDSPDLWIRNADDGGSDHQPPEHGQDNWFYARVRNKPKAGLARHLVVTFRTRGFVGTQFVYPSDFLPASAASAAFDLAPGETVVVKARWPETLVPPEGTHTCLLASVIARGDHPVDGRHVWEEDNLAQKNLTVVDLVADESFVLPVVVGNALSPFDGGFVLEVLSTGSPLETRLLARSKRVLANAGLDVRRVAEATAATPRALLDCGGVVPDRRGVKPGRFGPPASRPAFIDAWQTDPVGDGRIPVVVPPGDQTVIGLALRYPGDAKPSEEARVDLVQRHAKTGQVVGGVAVVVRPRSGR